jgi:hypothetical protein
MLNILALVALVTLSIGCFVVAFQHYRKEGPVYPIFVSLGAFAAAGVIAYVMVLVEQYRPPSLDQTKCVCSPIAE